MAVHEVQARFLLANAVKGAGTLPIVSADVAIAGAAAEEAAQPGGLPVAAEVAGGGEAAEAEAAPEAIPTVTASLVVDGCAFAVEPDGASVALVAVSPALQGALELPAEVEVAGEALPLARVSSGALDGSLVEALRLPASVGHLEQGALSGASALASIEVAEGSEALSSAEGLLYDAAGESLLAVPAALAEATVRDGCSSVAPGALEGCSQLRAIAAPASVVEVSPQAAGASAVPLAPVALAALVADGGSEGATEGAPSQTRATVELGAAPSNRTGLALVALADIAVALPEGANPLPWQAAGFSVDSEALAASAQSASTYAIASGLNYILALDVETGGNISTYSSTLGNYLDPNTTNATQGVNTTAATVSWVANPLNDAGSSTVTYTATSGSESGYTTFFISPAKGYEVRGYQVGVGTAPAATAAVQPSCSGGITRGVTTFVHVLFQKTLYAVTLDGNGADVAGGVPLFSWKYFGYTTNTSSDAVISAGGTVVPAASLPSRTGYTFAGYYTQASGGTQCIDANGRLTANAPELGAATTWYAHWTKNAVSTVNLNANGGSGGTVTVYLWYGKGWYSTSNPTEASTPLSTITAPTRAGYAYQGFATSRTATSASYWTSLTTFPSNTSSVFGSAATSRTTTLYAVWSKNAVSTVNLNANGGSGGTATVYLWYGKGWYSTSSPTDSSTPLSTITAPTRAGYAYKGFATTSTATSASYWTSASTFPSNTSAVFGSATTSKTTTLYAVWAKKAYCKVSLDANGGSGGTSTVYYWPDMGYVKTSAATAIVSSGSVLVSSQPSRSSYAFLGYYSDKTAGVQCTDSAGKLLTTAPDLSESSEVTWYARWGTAITLYANGSGAQIGLVGGTDFSFSEASPPGSAFELRQQVSSYICYEGGWFYFTADGYAAAPGMGQPCVVAKRPGYAFIGWSYEPEGDIAPTITQSYTTDVSGVPGVTLYARWATAVTLHANGEGAQVGLVGNADLDFSTTSPPGATFELSQPVKSYICYEGGWFYFTADGYAAAPGMGQPCVVAKRPGYAFIGWSYEPEGDIAPKLTQPYTSDVSGVPGITLYARWAPIIAADVPLVVTTALNVLGAQEQLPGEGYIESRCGEPLKVSAVSYAQGPGAAQLFGDSVPDVTLKALMGDGSSFFAFALDATGSAAREDDASLLSPLAMESLGARVPIAYLFDVPEEVLELIDPSLADVLIPSVCTVSYTVALA